MNQSSFCGFKLSATCLRYKPINNKCVSLVAFPGLSGSSIELSYFRWDSNKQKEEAIRSCAVITRRSSFLSTSSGPVPWLETLWLVYLGHAKVISSFDGPKSLSCLGIPTRDFLNRIHSFLISYRIAFINNILHHNLSSIDFPLWLLNLITY